MGILDGKKGIVMGVANSRSIATGVAEVLHREGASMFFSYLPDADGGDKMYRRVDKAVGGIHPLGILPCDLAKDESVLAFFANLKEHGAEFDFLVHAVAFAPLADIRCPTLLASRSGFLEAMNISVYSLIAAVRAASEFMPRGGSVVTMTYYGGEKVMPGYNMMGVCKAALDSSVRYLANDLGGRNIRVNSVSSGPLKTLASSAISNFSKMQKLNEEVTPLSRTLTKEDVGSVTAFLLSDYAAAISGELLHVDNGFHILGGGVRSPGTTGSSKQNV